MKPLGPCATTTAALRRCFVKFPQVERITTRLEALMAYQTRHEEAEHLMVLGETGTGKSTLIQNFSIRCACVEHESHREVPLLVSAISARMTIKALAGKLLMTMGSAYWDRGDEVDRTHQLVTLLKACCTRLIILDEVNHLVDRGGNKTHYLVADWIKEVGSASGVSIALFGTPRAARLLLTNEQLGSRFGETIELLPFSATEEGIAVFRGALMAFRSLMKAVDTIDFTQPGHAVRIALATNGRLREIRKLLVRAVEIAFQSPTPFVTLEVFEQAFSQVIFPKCPDSRNPFSSRFKGGPLVKPGEPFAVREAPNGRGY